VGGLNLEQAVLSGEIRKVKHIGIISLTIVMSIAHSILRVNKILGKWIGAYDGAKRLQGSGWSENDVLAKAQEIYACGKNVQFTLMAEWYTLHDQPRYSSHVGGNIGS
jgi:hypothetical protein